MSQRFRLPLPVWQLQFQLLGGPRRLIVVFVVAVLILVIAIVGTHRLSQMPFVRISRAVLMFLTGIQMFVTVLAGCNAIHRAMLRDYQSKMVESHRLTPMSSLAIVMGYLFGPTIHSIMLFCVFTAAGAVVCRVGGRPVDMWIYGNLLLLSGAVMLWAGGVFLGMQQDKPTNPAPIVVGFAALSVPIAMVPVLGLLSGVYAGYLSVWMMVGTLTVPPQATIVVVVVSLAYTLFWVSTATVKYRRPDLPALTGARGLFLLGMSLLIGAGGIVAFKQIATNASGLSGLGEFYRPGVVRTQWLATLIGALLLAAVVTAGAVQCSVLRSRGTAMRGRSDRMSPLTIAILSAFMICAIMAGVGSPIWRQFLPGIQSDLLRDNVALYAQVWGWTAAACLLATLTFRSVLEIGYRLLSSPKVLMIVFLFVAWGVPPMIDSARMVYMREAHGLSVDYSWLSGCCPVGTLVTLWAPLDIRLWPGLLIQIGVLGILILIARRARRKEEVKSR